MITINYSPNFWEGMERITEFLIAAGDSRLGLEVYDDIIDGIKLLAKHPEIGRMSADSHFRELVISRGKTGYIALYVYNEVTDMVTIVAIRHQRESGF